MQSSEQRHDSDEPLGGVKKTVAELEKVGDERLARETERFFEYLEEEENKRK